MKYLFTRFETEEKIPCVVPENDYEEILASFINHDVRENYSSYLIDVRRGPNGEYFNYKYDRDNKNSEEAIIIESKFNSNEKRCYSEKFVRECLIKWRDHYLKYNLCDLSNNRLSVHNIAWSFLIYYNNCFYSCNGERIEEIPNSYYIDSFYNTIFEVADALTTDPKRVYESLSMVYGSEAEDIIIDSFRNRTKELLQISFQNENDVPEDRINDYFDSLLI